MQRLRDKLVISERTAKAEAQIKVRFCVYIIQSNLSITTLFDQLYS